MDEFAELFRFRQSATDVQGIVCMACSHGNFVDPGEESDAQNRYGPCNRRGDVGFGGDLAVLVPDLLAQPPCVMDVP